MTLTETRPDVAGSETVHVRSSALDKLRGLAVALMVLDHLALFLEVLPVRLTLGRLAMPLFFLVAGHLAYRLSRRHGLALVLGLALPWIAPWVDSPNVLLWWAVFSAVLVGARYLSWSPVFYVAAALTFAANGWFYDLGTSYEPYALLGLMALGQLLPRSSFAFADRLPGVFASIGRRPLTWYVGHVLVLVVVFA